VKLARNVDDELLARHPELSWSYLPAGQTGSHMKLRTDQPIGHPVIIPEPRPLKTGTLHSILKSVALHKNVSLAEVGEGL
jgi:hypothetical protein